MEQNTDIHMLPVNAEDQEDFNSSINNLSKIGQSIFELWIFEVLINPYYGHLQVGNSARICDVIAHNSPLAMYIEVHKISFFIYY